jgi:release factor glutamine methyltransferase
VPDSEYALLQRNVREYEPAGALKGGFDGLEHYRKVVSGAPQWLAKGGTIAVEIGVGQAGPCAQILQEAGIEFVEFVPDLAGRQRVITGRSRI